MGLLKDWTARWMARLSGQAAEGPGSVFITLDEKKTPVDMRTGDATPEAYEEYIGKMVKNFDKRGYLPG